MKRSSNLHEHPLGSLIPIIFRSLVLIAAISAMGHVTVEAKQLQGAEVPSPADRKTRECPTLELDVLIGIFEAFEGRLSWCLSWHNSVMKWLRGVQGRLKELRARVKRLKRPTEDDWRDRVPYPPDYHP